MVGHTTVDTYRTPGAERQERIHWNFDPLGKHSAIDGTLKKKMATLFI